MAGVWEIQRVRQSVIIPEVTTKTGGEVKVDEERYRDEACPYCDIVTHSYEKLWTHRLFAHHITSDNIARVGRYVDAMIARAERKEGLFHYIVTVVRVAHALGLYGEMEYKGLDVEIIDFTDKIGKDIYKQAKGDFYQQTILKTVADRFIDKYRDKIWKNWDLVNSGEIKKEIDIKEEDGISNDGEYFVNDGEDMARSDDECKPVLASVAEDNSVDGEGESSVESYRNLRACEICGEDIAGLDSRDDYKVHMELVHGENDNDDVENDVLQSGEVEPIRGGAEVSEIATPAENNVEEEPTEADIEPMEDDVEDSEEIEAMGVVTLQTMLN